ncbi:MAG: hypothetical protein RI894_1248 [Bacteroidota bacterium]|jgi:hypothetical protein
MDISLLAQGAITLLSPLLMKAGEKAAETIGEKLGANATDAGLWKTITRIFITDDETALIAAIESKPVASPQELEAVHAKISAEIHANPQFAAEVQAAFNITPLNEFIASEKIKSIARLTAEIEKLVVQMERAGTATSGDYINRIEGQEEKLAYQTNELFKILKF